MQKFKKVDLVQGTQAWLDWRNSSVGGTAITATAASIIMGLYYRPETPDIFELDKPSKIWQLWAEKVGLVEEVFEPNAAMIHGSNTEETARQAFIKLTGENVEPVCVEHLDYPFMKASLDGLTVNGDLILEVKSPMFLGSFLKHKNYGPPNYYISQIQHQLFVTGSELACFFSYYDRQYVLWEVKPNIEFQHELLRRCILFNNLVKNKIEPTEEVFCEYAGNMGGMQRVH